MTSLEKFVIAFPLQLVMTVDAVAVAVVNDDDDHFECPSWILSSWFRLSNFYRKCMWIRVVGKPYNPERSIREGIRVEAWASVGSGFGRSSAICSCCCCTVLKGLLGKVSA